jgi:8-amino-7-oxononanoate synthase
MNGFSRRLEAELAARREQGLYRHRLTLASGQGPQIEIDGREYINFCSNDYLGLASHSRLIESYRLGAAQYGVGSGASHLVCGHSRPHQQLEEALARFTGRPRALLFSCGYMANMGVLTTLLKKGDSVFQDRLNHASLLDGGLASGARFRRFLHSDSRDLAAKLSHASGEKLVAVDGVFSMDGDTAPLSDLARVCGEHEAWLMVDDAHGFGVMGADGAGTTQEFGLDTTQVPVLMATLGKAMGTAGAFVAGSEVLIETLIQSARNYIYTTAIPPAVAAASLTALELLSEESWRRDHLRALIDRFRQAAIQLSLPVMASDSAIQPLLVGEPDQAQALSLRLRDQGILVGAIRPPTVPRGTSRLRITLSAAHTEQQVDQLLDQLAKCYRDD